MMPEFPYLSLFCMPHKEQIFHGKFFTYSAKLQPDYLLYYKIHIGILLVVTHEWFDFISFTEKPRGYVFLKSLCLFLNELNCNISISSRTFGLKYDLEE